jgi:hypothetical protein
MNTDHIQNLTDTSLTFTQKERDEIAVHHYLSTIDPQHWFEQIAPRLDQGRDSEQYRKLSAPGMLASTALWYADQGIAVFPLQPRSKIPMRGSRGCKDATTDIEQISSWWTQMPNANIGMVTGFQFDVIDVDGPDGFESLSHLKPIANVLASVITPRGRHIYVKARSDRKNGTKLMDGIDIRAKGGYVVAPPSINAEGKIYTWLITPENLANHCE